MDNQVKKIEKDTYKLLNKVEELIKSILETRHENTKFKKYLNINQDLNSKYRELISKNQVNIKNNT